MRRRFLLAAALSLTAATPAAAQTAPTLQWGEILIYQSEILNSVLPDETQLSAYIDRIEVQTARVFGTATPGAAVSGVLFVAIKPGGRARVWVLTTNGSVARPLQTSLERTLGLVQPVDVRADFLFGLAFGAWGGASYASSADQPPPIPAEWEAQIPPEGVMLDDAFINRVWPN